MKETYHPLSPRLQALFDMVPEGLRLTDIGTDHGWLPIDLVMSGKIKSAIAMDLRVGPLERARSHIEEAGLTGQIETRQSDGFSALKVGEADAAVLSGMGGNLMMRILDQQKEIVSSMKVLILQPQSELYDFRLFLHREGYRLVDEMIAEEEGKFYFLMKVLPPGSDFFKAKDLSSFWRGLGLPEPLALKLGFTFGPVLLMKKDPALVRYLHHEEEIQLGIARSLEEADSQDERIRQRLTKLREDMALLHLALQIVEG
jgi:tRNA (adenine22-N1)-methyltransferase